MNYLFTISLRNLFRQKRRNILLGTAIAFGTAILIMANSFAHGISDILFNQIVVYVAGHISVSYNKDGNLYNQIFHDGDRMKEIIRKNVPDITQLQEAIGIMARAIGNGRSDNVIMVGMDMDIKVGKKEEEEYRKHFKMVDGTFEDLKNPALEHPVALAVDKAKYLGIKRGDVIRVRFTDINNQNQAARLTVACLFKPSNAFMSAPIFLETKDLKQLLGYGPHDVAQMYIRIKEPKKNAKRYADSLHAALGASTAMVFGPAASASGRSAQTAVFGFRTDSISLLQVDSAIQIVQSDTGSAIDRREVFASESLATALSLKPGDSCYVSYKGKFDSTATAVRFVITGIIKNTNGVTGNMLLVNERDFYKPYYIHWPDRPDREDSLLIPAKDSRVASVLVPEWNLMKRSRTTQEVQKAMRDIGQKRWKGMSIDVQSMYESASMVLNLEYALQLITFIAVMLLFFIILIGVINTLRMTIRERTKEIGTIRAIGMQQKDVRNTFLLEAGFLALFSSLTGTVIAFLGMWLLSMWTIDVSDNPLGMLLDNGHLHFLPTVGATVGFNLFIIGISVFTAFFPARRAAKLSSADALRHIE